MPIIHYAEDTGNTPVPVAAESPLPVTFGDSSSVDAYGRLRVSEPLTLHESQNQYDVNPLFWDEATTGSASSAHDADNSAVDMTVTSAASDEIIRQTFEYFRYQSGKSLQIFVTVGFGTLGDEARARAGYFDADNGIFVQQLGSATSVVLRTKVTGSVVDNLVAQADWNVDKFDGNGPSGISNFDPTKSQLFVVDLEWLSVGRVRVGFIIGGMTRYVHYFNTAPAVTGAYMTTANLPVRYELKNVDGGSVSYTIKKLCSTVTSEGGFTPIGASFSANNGITTIAVTTRRPLLSIRPKSTFNSITNRGSIVLATIGAIVSTNNALIEIVYDGTLTGASFGSVNASSIVDFDVAATAISGGIVTNSFYAASAQGQFGTDFTERISSILSKYPLTLDIAGANPFNVSVVATSLNATSNLGSYLRWNESR